MTPAKGTAPRIFVVANFVMACCWRVTRLPLPGETLVASALSMEPGGKGLNVAIGTHRLGARVDVMLGIGSDAAGQRLLDLLAAEGLPTAHVHSLGPQSGYGAGLIGDNGQNAIAVFPGPNLLLGAAHAEQAESDIAAASLVYGQFETSVPAVQRAFELARRHGVRTVLNPSPWQAMAARLLACTDVIVANEVEAAHLLGLDAALAGLGARQVASLLEPAAMDFCKAWRAAGQTLDEHSTDELTPTRYATDHHPPDEHPPDHHPPGARQHAEPLLIVTLGAQGCVAFQSGAEPLAREAWAVDAVDTMGAGDAFASALCLALCDAVAPGAALERANAAGAWMASRRGVLDALPSTATLDAFYASRRIL